MLKKILLILLSTSLCATEQAPQRNDITYSDLTYTEKKNSLYYITKP